MHPTDTVIVELRERLERYPALRYPAQHATAQFHLGTVMANAGNLEEAAAALQTAARLFAETPLVAERAKVLNALGAVARLGGDLNAAAQIFQEAAGLFDSSGNPLEEGAAQYNLGLTQSELGLTLQALESLRRAQTLLDPDKVPRQAAAAARELGATLLTAGDLVGAAGMLEDAAELSRRAGDHAGLAAACNSLGLAQLAGGDAPAAVASFQAAVGASPRTIRGEAYAMAKANLALAYERSEQSPRARLAAGQALRVRDAAQPVREQSEAILNRLGDSGTDLLSVLALEEEQSWPEIMHEEVGSWPEMQAAALRSAAGAFVAGLPNFQPGREDLAGAWVGVLLELTPEQMERIIELTLQACKEQDPKSCDAFRSLIQRAIPRFPSPQFLRLKDSFARAARDLEMPGWD